MFLNKYPYTDEHELNLDWIIQQIKTIESSWESFQAANEILWKGAWNSLVSYKKYSIVDYDGSGYFSIQDVPAGTDISNTKYWVLVANYSALYAEMQTKLGTLQEDTDTLKENVSDLQEDVTELNADVSALNISNPKKMKDLSDRFFLFIGDSYGIETLPSWVEYSMTYLGLGSDQYSNVSEGGSGFNSGTTFYNQAADWSGDHSKVTDLVIGGGFNDATFTFGSSGMNDLITRINDFASMAKTSFPNAKVWLSFFGNALDKAPVIQSTGTHSVAYRRICKYVYDVYGRENGFNIIEASQALALTSQLFRDDYVHPNEYGERTIANIISNALNYSPVKSFYPIQSIDLTLSGGKGAVLEPQFFYEVDEDMTVITRNIIQVTTPDLTTITSGNWYLIGTFNRLYFNHKMILPADIALYNYNGLDIINCSGYLKYDGEYLHFMITDTSGGSYVSFTAGSNPKMALYEGSDTFPTWYIN